MLKVTQRRFKVNVCVNPKSRVLCVHYSADIEVAKGLEWTSGRGRTSTGHGCGSTSHLREEGTLAGQEPRGSYRRLAAACTGSGWEDAERLEAKRGGAAPERVREGRIRLPAGA